MEFGRWPQLCLVAVVLFRNLDFSFSEGSAKYVLDADSHCTDIRVQKLW